ncbi:hypothetical protein G7078_08040 [Sphingomonas sinipercae]|uniref:Uncharacterized protein n=1 Tax=Sphingomonas sinipercae TaxID=2714944 RepID=A0A6G7ZP13_9SPHN|nr:hypothetical protein [Sphingomonas sinipercae]QIL02737.1 hypothetical protein G7078_08040 [Sphingomonas sinipercae]
MLRRARVVVLFARVPELRDGLAALLEAFAPALDARAAVPGFLAVPALLRALLVDRDAVPLERDVPPPDESSPLAHFPLIIRCAASATASAISEPKRVALDMTELAADEALSAASRPASRIFLRALGLALIAAAAAARPAASISLLIAALASLSTVDSLELLEREEPLDFAAEPPDFRFVDDDFRLVDFATQTSLFGSYR